MELLYGEYVIIEPRQGHEMNGYRLTTDPTSKHTLEGKVILSGTNSVKVGDEVGYILPKDKGYILPDNNHIISKFLILYKRGKNETTNL